MTKPEVIQHTFMRNIFLVYMPPSNAPAMQHFQETIERRVPQERFARYLRREDRDRPNRRLW